MLTTGFPRWEGDLFGFFVAEQAQALAEAGHEVEVVAPAAPGLSGPVDQDGYRVIRTRYAWPGSWQQVAYGGGLVPNLRARPWLTALLPGFITALGWAASARAIRSRIFHGQWVAAGLIGRLTRPLHGKPVVVTLRGTDLALLRGLPVPLARLMLSGFERVLTVSAEIAEAVRGFGIAADRVVLTPNGVNADLFHPRDRSVCRTRLDLTDGPLLMWAGRLAPEKGLDVLLKALARLRVDQPAARLVLFGDGHLKDELQALTAELNLTGAVDFRGAAPRAQLADWYGAADIVCLSSHREGRPNTVLEALAAGRPVLSTRVGGVPELVRDGIEGSLVPAADPDAMARAAGRMLADSDALAAMGAAGPQRLRELGLTWRANAEVMAEVYRDVIAETDPHRRPGWVGRRRGGRWAAGAASVVALGWLGLTTGQWLARHLARLDASYGLTDRLNSLLNSGLGG